MSQRKAKSNRGKTASKKPPRQIPEVDPPADTEAQAAAEQQLLQAQALSPDIAAGAIGLAELQRQLGEQTAVAGVLRTRLAFAGQVVAEKEAEIQSLKAQLAGSDGAAPSA